MFKTPDNTKFPQVSKAHSKYYYFLHFLFSSSVTVLPSTLIDASLASLSYFLQPVTQKLISPRGIRRQDARSKERK